MIIIALDTLCEQIGPSLRRHFADLLKERDSCLAILNTNNQQMVQFITYNWEMIKNLDGPFPVLINSRFAFPFRIKRNEFIWIHNFDIVHLRNSVITNILLPETSSRNFKHALNKVLYIFYHYWFIKKNASIDDLTRSACFELQELVKMIMERELTIYRNYTTAPLIEAIRWRVAEENIYLLTKNRTLNMRKI